MTKWIILVRRDNRRGIQWEIAAEVSCIVDAMSDLKSFKARLGDDRVRLFVDYFQLQSGDV